MAQGPRAQDERGCGAGAVGPAEAGMCLKDQVVAGERQIGLATSRSQRLGKGKTTTITQNKGIRSGVDGVPRALPNPGQKDQGSGR